MGVETFPEIENFQKLPRKVIVKGGSSSYTARDGAELRGIVINNSGHSIAETRVHVVVFTQNMIPIVNLSTPADPDVLPQGGMGSFTFRVKNFPREITEYHLYTTWRFNE